MSDLHELFVQSISSGLKQKSLTVCSKWACANRVMGPPFPGNFSFKYHPWLKAIHDCDAESMVGQKAAQLGYTEAALNLTFFKIGVQRIDCLYLLPATHPDATDFSSSRFDVALELSPTLANLFSDVRNVGHKRAGTANLYVRGSRSRSGLKSIPVGFIVFDEVDEMDQDNIPLAMERMSGQRNGQDFKLSTPTVDDYGINRFFKDSTQERFFFACPCCNRQTELTFPECLVITAERITDERINESKLICKECKGVLHHEDKSNFLAKGAYVPAFPGRASRGFQVNQLYSSGIAGRPDNLARAYLKSMDDPANEQEFYNSKLARTHVVDGAKVTDQDLESCKAGHRMAPPTDTTFITMGCDVGRWLHVEITEWLAMKNPQNVDINAIAIAKPIYIGKCTDFQELATLFLKFGVYYAVVDAQPERRKAYEFAMMFPGRVSLCFYGNSVAGKQLNISSEAYAEPTVTVDRTSWLDVSLSRFRTKRIALPQDTPMEYKNHVKNLVRIYKKDERGNPIGSYVNTGDDHFAHARNYAEIALPLALNMGVTSTITKGSL